MSKIPIGQNAKIKNHLSGNDLMGICTADVITFDGWGMGSAVGWSAGGWELDRERGGGVELPSNLIGYKTKLAFKLML